MSEKFWRDIVPMLFIVIFTVVLIYLGITGH